jgi:hypothetical protein
VKNKEPIDYAKLKLSHHGAIHADHDLEIDRPKSTITLPKSQIGKPKNRKSTSVIEISAEEIKGIEISSLNKMNRNSISVSHNNSVISCYSGNGVGDKLGDRTSCNSSIRRNKSKRMKAS